MEYNDENNSEDEQNSEYDENGRKKIVLRELTVLEQQMHTKAREKHIQNITKPQIVQGKTFQGDSFLSKPDKIIFKDFDVNEPYIQTIYLTNVSYTFNSFKLKPLKESIRDQFEIMYKPPGRISAGMSCPITIRFTAQTIDDIDDVFPILTETGPVNIPLICTSKKAICECINPIIDFEKVIFGEDCTKTLTIINRGALQTEISIKSAKGLDILSKTEVASQMVNQVINEQQSEQEEKVRIDQQQDLYQQNLIQSLSQLKFSKVYKIKGYSELHIPIKYLPNQIGTFDLPLMLYFENYLHSPPINIIIKGECIQVPIYVEKPIYDFEICLLNHIYREKIIFYNRSQNAMKTQIVAPKETKQFFQFNPLLGYIQGNSKFEVWVKMNADKDLLTFCSKYLDKQTGFLDIPFKLIGADQVMPVPFTIRTRMTINTVQITPGKINFGKLYEGTASRMALTCENLSELPQEILFYPLPKEISVELDLIPIKLLPKEKFQTNLIYRSTKIPGVNSRKDEGYLKCKIITGTIATKDIKIPYSCDIHKCPLEFSAMKIDIPATQVDEVFQSTLQIKNSTNKAILFEFFLPKFEICGLKLSPMVQKIQSEESVEIHLEFFSFFKKLTAFTLDELAQKYDNDPNFNFQLRMKIKREQQEEERKKNENQNQTDDENTNKNNKKQTNTQKESKKDNNKKLSKAQLQAQEEEQKRLEELEKQKEEQQILKKQQVEQNFNMEEELAKLGGKLLEFNKEQPNHNQQYTWLIPCYFKHTDMPDASKFLTFIEINTVTVNKSLLLDKTIIDFGEIAVGIREIKELLITNNSDQIADIRTELLPLFSGFSVINALRPINPFKTRNIVVQFQPHEDKPFEEILKIKCKTTCVSAKLIGKGVRPEVKLIPENGLLNIGGVILGEKAEKTFKVLNVSNFSIKFKVTSISHGIYNKNGSKVFSFIPSEVQIEAHKEIEIKLIFQPDRISEQFFELVSIDVPNQKDEKKLFIYGSCYPRQSYITHYKPILQLPQSNSLPAKIESAFDQLKILDEETIFSPKNTRILLEFTKPKIKEVNVFQTSNNDKQEEIEGENNNNNEDNNNEETMFLRKLIIGNSKIYSDPKLEKPCNYEVIMPKDDKNNYFLCDNPKGTVTAGNEAILLFRLKPPQMDNLISNIEALQGLGQWREIKAELKLSGGYLNQGQTDLWQFDVILRAYINQI